MLRIEITEPDGAPRVVELHRKKSTLGRDATCDIVLDNVRCSRIHAVITQDASGTAIKDAQSTNGIFVNGRLVRRAPLYVGDEVRIGDVMLRMLPAVDALSVASPEPASPPSGSETPVAQPSIRTLIFGKRGVNVSRPPLTIIVITAFWWIATFSGLLAVLFAFSPRGTAALATHARLAIGLLGALLMIIGLVMGTSLLARASWVRAAHLLLCGAGLASCIFTLPSIVLLLYFLRPQSDAMSAPATRRRGTTGESVSSNGLEVVFSLTLLLYLGVSTLLAIAAYSILVSAQTSSGRIRLSATEQAAVARMRKIVDAEESFRRVCNTGYGDLEALLHPITVIPSYSKDGPGFLPSSMAISQADGYVFTLVIEELMPPAKDCPTRRYRRYQYSATPLLGNGWHFVVGADGIVRRARARPATLADPALPRE